jgi:hypothetical protein
MSKPSNISPVQWDQALGLARQSCARIFRDGGAPPDALGVYGIKMAGVTADWDHAIASIAQSLCAPLR